MVRDWSSAYGTGNASGGGAIGNRGRRRAACSASLGPRWVQCVCGPRPLGLDWALVHGRLGSIWSHPAYTKLYQLRGDYFTLGGVRWPEGRLCVWCKATRDGSGPRACSRRASGAGGPHAAEAQGVRRLRRAGPRRGGAAPPRPLVGAKVEGDGCGQGGASGRRGGARAARGVRLLFLSLGREEPEPVIS